MKKTYKLVDLDCANCAQRMEDAIKKLGGVQDASISFFSQKLTLTANDDDFETVLQNVIKTCKRIEPDCKIKI